MRAGSALFEISENPCAAMARNAGDSKPQRFLAPESGVYAAVCVD